MEDWMMLRKRDHGFAENQATSERVQDGVENLLVLFMDKPPSALPLRSLGMYAS
jgi:hypothetical protein